MIKYYLLAPMYALRGWKRLPYAIQNLYYPKTEFFREHEWHLLKACNGNTPIDWNALPECDRAWYEKWEYGGFIFPCKQGETLNPNQEYHFYSA